MAAAIGDVEWLKQSLRESGSQINFDKNGLTALHLAAIHGRLECVKLCLEKFKQDVNLASSTGWRPVHLAISNQTGQRSLRCLSYLLEKGADPSIENDDGITPVHQAASEGHVQCLKLLIEVGAKIDGKDCRGNTPLDLAKLWAHRKCARILAAEMWHQDKNSVAKEMHQLKKVKMQQVLKELEDEEEAKLDAQFYGQAAYEQWLSSRGLEPKTTGPSSERPPQKEKKASVKIREPLTKPNSVASRGSQDVTAEKGALTMSVSIGQKSSASSKASRKDTVATIMSEADFGLHDIDPQAGTQEKKKVKHSAYVNPNKWNPSPFIKKKEYVPILNDEFPRDEYTMMHMVEGGKKFYDGKHAKEEKNQEDPEKIKKKKLREPQLPKEVIERVLSNDPTTHERPVLFKPKHIADVHKKHKYTLDEKPPSEAPLHLCNDITSQMVKMSIRFPEDPSKDYFIHRKRGSAGKASSTSSGSKSSNTTAFTEWNPQVYPLPELLTTLKQMSKPDSFPYLPGRGYGTTFGDLASY
ncbi:uncharacterized protein LOC143275862 [Babylonia areolata]|uniref:uncharacterized protein LOC143275862 n=1 Tax=Babylonia areolata TaxID=304850 RepID=UPI003FD2195C